MNTRKPTIKMSKRSTSAPRTKEKKNETSFSFENKI